MSGSCSATVSTHGATVLSWNVDGKELLFLSKLANASNPNPGKGIRGGIPVVFPNFGPWECGPQHGFARGKQWEVTSQTPAAVVFTLQNDEETEKVWAHKFLLTYTVSAKENSLIVELVVKNDNTDASFDFTALLHTYLRVPDVRKINIQGLGNLNYFNSLTNKEDEGQPEIEGLNENVDRVYKSTGPEHVVKYENSAIVIGKENLPDTVLWNPWVEKAKGMKDFGDEEYLEMVCVEPGYVGERKVIQPGEEWKSSQVLTVRTC